MVVYENEYLPCQKYTFHTFDRAEYQIIGRLKT